MRILLYLTAIMACMARITAADPAAREQPPDTTRDPLSVLDTTLPWDTLLANAVRAASISDSASLGDWYFDNVLRATPGGTETRKRYYDNGTLKEETYGIRNDKGEFIDHGPCRMWHSNGARQVACTYRDGRKDGYYFSWYEHGQPEIEGFFARDKLHVEVTWYFETGRPMKQTEYRFGRRHGRHVRWYANGNVRMKCRFEDDVLHGPFISYYETGSVEEEGRYDRGRKIIEKAYARPRKVIR